jgi:GrpB-like predicted nucleotidyltransferase (UPF0157 family)
VVVFFGRHQHEHCTGIERKHTPGSRSTASRSSRTCRSPRKLLAPEAMIELIPYEESWPSAFVMECKRIRSQFGDRAVRIDHVGSTSVPGLAAKPVIDIQVSVASLEPRGIYGADMRALGYAHVDLGGFDRVYPFFTRPKQWPSTHHVHICEAGAEQERKHLAFRDYLRQHPCVAAEYLELKKALARIHVGATHEERDAYSLSKSDFVNRVLAEAFALGLPVVGSSDG